MYIQADDLKTGVKIAIESPKREVGETDRYGATHDDLMPAWNDLQKVEQIAGVPMVVRSINLPFICVNVCGKQPEVHGTYNHRMHLMSGDEHIIDIRRFNLIPVSDDYANQYVLSTRTPETIMVDTVFSKRTAKRLFRCNIHTISDLMKRRADLIWYDGIGMATVREIDEYLRRGV